MPSSLNSSGVGDPRKALRRGGAWGGETLVVYIAHRFHGRAEANYSSVRGIRSTSA